MERKAAQQNKNKSEELKQGPPSHSSKAVEIFTMNLHR